MFFMLGVMFFVLATCISIISTRVTMDFFFYVNTAWVNLQANAYKHIFTMTTATYNASDNRIFVTHMVLKYFLNATTKT